MDRFFRTDFENATAYDIDLVKGLELHRKPSSQKIFAGCLSCGDGSERGSGMNAPLAEVSQKPSVRGDSRLLIATLYVAFIRGCGESAEATLPPLACLTSF